MDQKQIRQTIQIKEIFSFYRSFILDLFEEDLKNDPRWPMLRARLLKIFSPERGLEAKIIEIMNAGGTND